MNVHMAKPVQNLLLISRERLILNFSLSVMRSSIVKGISAQEFEVIVKIDSNKMRKSLVIFSVLENL